MPDWVSQLNTIVLNVVTTQKSVFQNWGNTVWLSLSIIIIVIFGIRTAFAGYMDFNSLLKTIMLIATVRGMIQAYSNGPAWIPGGLTFPQLIINGPKALASQLSYSSMDQMTQAINTALESHPTNPFAGLSALVTYWLMWILIELAQAVMWAVTCFGLVAQAVCVIVGPLFIPMLLIKPLDFLFWGWFKSFLQYSFYPLVCACYTYILSTFLTNELTLVFGGSFNLGSIAAAGALVPFLIVIILSMLTVPSVVSALFTGGQATLGNVLQSVGMARFALGK